jgi:hypothetical protein
VRQGVLSSVTLTVPSIAPVAAAYCDWLGYQTVAEGRVTARLAESWDAPLTVGSRWAELRAAAETQCVLRLVERPSYPGFAPLLHHGWNANEILCADPVDLAERFSQPGSPFRVIGAPQALDSNPRIVALQALGPAGELNYFTRLPPEGGSLIKTPARSPVDRSFIVVLGGPDLGQMQTFYRDTLGLTVSPRFGSVVAVLNAAHDLPGDTRTPLSLVALSSSYAIELDEYPASATARPCRPGDLPPGIAMVGLSTTAHTAQALPWRRPPTLRDSEAPHAGLYAGLIVGAAAERIELVAPI